MTIRLNHAIVTSEPSRKTHISSPTIERRKLKMKKSSNTHPKTNTQYRRQNGNKQEKLVPKKEKEVKAVASPFKFEGFTVARVDYVSDPMTVSGRVTIGDEIAIVELRANKNAGHKARFEVTKVWNNETLQLLIDFSEEESCSCRLFRVSADEVVVAVITKASKPKVVDIVSVNDLLSGMETLPLVSTYAKFAICDKWIWCSYELTDAEFAVAAEVRTLMAEQAEAEALEAEVKAELAEAEALEASMMADRAEVLSKGNGQSVAVEKSASKQRARGSRRKQSQAA